MKHAPIALADDLIRTPGYDHPMLEFFSMLVVVQLRSMEIAMRLGNDVDMPRNLAKSVTVEWGSNSPRYPSVFEHPVILWRVKPRPIV
jgi:hypothetical protein